MERPYSRLNADGHVVAITGPDGGLLWRKRFQERVSNHMVCDLEGDGLYEILIATESYDYKHEGLLFFYDHQGTLLWKRSFASDTFKIPYKRSARRGDHGGDFQLFPQVLNAWTEDLDSDNIKEIILTVSAAFCYNPNMICILDKSNHVKGLFWSPGGFNDIKEVQSPVSNSSALVILGLNNEFTTREEKAKSLYRFVLFMLEPSVLDEKFNQVIQKAPHKEDKHTCSSCSWYRILPKTLKPITLIDTRLTILEDGTDPGKSKIEVKQGDHIFTFDLMGEMVKMDITPELKISAVMDNNAKKIEAYKNEVIQQFTIYRCRE